MALIHDVLEPDVSGQLMSARIGNESMVNDLMQVGMKPSFLARSNRVPVMRIHRPQDVAPADDSQQHSMLDDRHMTVAMAGKDRRQGE
jgi:hypothetical protein